MASYGDRSVLGESAGAAPAAHDFAGAEHTADTLADVNSKISDATLIDTTDPRLSNPIQNGFVDITDSTISFADGTPGVFTIEPAVTSFDYYADGVLYTKSSAQNINIPDVEGLHYVYFDDGVLTTSTTFDTAMILTHALVAVLYWDLTNQQAIIVADERHGRDMDCASHLALHRTIGTAYVSGLALGNITADGAGDDPSHTTLSVADGIIADEDIDHTITDGSPQTLSAIAEIPMFYRLGASGAWRRIAATNYAVTPTGTGRAAWNEYTGGAWQLTEIADGKFVLSHIFATGDITHPIIGIVGQADYGNIPAARTGATEEINNLLLGPLSSLLAEIRPIGTVIFQTNDTYTSGVHSRIRTNDEGDDYVDWRTSGLTGASSTTDHGDLAGLDDDDHPYAVDLRRAADISGLTAKAVPVGADVVMIDDSADSDAKKSVALSTIAAEKILTTTGPQVLTVAGITDGEFFKRVGNEVVSAAAGGGPATQITETGGPTDLDVASVADTYFVARSGTDLVGVAPGAAAGTASARAIGTGALEACAGNDARLSDSRTPTAHDLAGALHNTATQSAFNAKLSDANFGNPISHKTQAVSPFAMTVASHNGYTFTNIGATAEVVFTLPACISGPEYTFIVAAAYDLTLNLGGSDTIRIAGSVSTAGGDCKSSTVGSVIRIKGIDADQYVAVFSSGTWTLSS